MTFIIYNIYYMGVDILYAHTNVYTYLYINKKARSDQA